MDNQRVSQQNRRSSLESKEDRKALLQVQNEVYEDEAGLMSAISFPQKPQWESPGVNKVNNIGADGSIRLREGS
ncbi:hypothetical protein TNCV_2758241 [Trichonephila clavipes]|nr:hypothetical protein TNCV_2758241 [Trichonephila clavipes]